MSPVSRRRAFTMVELIVVLVVLALLATLAVVGYSAVIDRTKEEATAITLHTVLREATALAALDQSSDLNPYIEQAVADLPAQASAAGVTAAVLSNEWEYFVDDGVSDAYGKIVHETGGDGRALLGMQAANGRCIWARGTVSGGNATWKATDKPSVCDLDDNVVVDPSNCDRIEALAGGDPDALAKGDDTQCPPGGGDPSGPDGDDGTTTTTQPGGPGDDGPPTVPVPCDAVGPDVWVGAINCETVDEDDPGLNGGRSTGLLLAPKDVTSFVSTDPDPPHRFLVADGKRIVQVTQTSETTAAGSVFADGLTGAKAITVGPDPTVAADTSRLVLYPVYVAARDVDGTGAIFRIDPVTRTRTTLVTGLDDVPDAFAQGAYACLGAGGAPEAGRCLYDATGTHVWKTNIVTGTRSEFMTFADAQNGGAPAAVSELGMVEMGGQPMVAAGSGSNLYLAPAAAAAGTTPVEVDNLPFGTSGIANVAPNSPDHAGMWLAIHQQLDPEQPAMPMVVSPAAGAPVALSAVMDALHYHGRPSFLYGVSADAALHEIDLNGTNRQIFPVAPAGCAYETHVEGGGELGPHLHCWTATAENSGELTAPLATLPHFSQNGTFSRMFWHYDLTGQDMANPPVMYFTVGMDPDAWTNTNYILVLDRGGNYESSVQLSADATCVETQAGNCTLERRAVQLPPGAPATGILEFVMWAPT